MPDLTLGFAGSPDFAAHLLARLVEEGLVPKLVLTQPDARSGRGRKLQANAVKQVSETHGLPILQPVNLTRDIDAQESLRNAHLDLLIVAAYGLLLPQAVLDIPRLGCLNVHASLLPRWRGAAPIERALMAGDRTTGICLMRMEAGLDTGPVYSRHSLDIGPEATGISLEQDLAQLGADALIVLLRRVAAGGALPDPAPQEDTGMTYADKLTAADRPIDWTKSATSLRNEIRALSGRLPKRCEIAGVGVQILAANVISSEASARTASPGPTDSTIAHDTIAPGTIVATSKQGIEVACATEILQIVSLRFEKGKGSVLNAAAALNGYSDLLSIGNRFD